MISLEYIAVLVWFSACFPAEGYWPGCLGLGLRTHAAGLLLNIVRRMLVVWFS